MEHGVLQFYDNVGGNGSKHGWNARNNSPASQRPVPRKATKRTNHSGIDAQVRRIVFLRGGEEAVERGGGHKPVASKVALDRLFICLKINRSSSKQHYQTGDRQDSSNRNE